MSTIPFARTRTAPLSLDIAKQLPSNVEYERHILGAILLDNSLLAKVRDQLTAADFYSGAETALSPHGRIYSAMLGCADQGKPVEILALIDHLAADNVLSALIASLPDGVPAGTNILYYVKQLKEKSRLREIIRKTHEIQQRAMERDAGADALCNQLETFSKQSTTSHENPMVIVGCRELLTLDFPEPKWVIGPLLTVGGTMMVYAGSGVGKSFITTEMACHISMGLPTMFCGRQGEGGLWPIPEALPVLYLYGEMHGGEIKKRWKGIAAGHGSLNVPEDGQLGFVCKEYQRIKRAAKCAYDWRPTIFSSTDRRIIEDALAAGGYKVLVLDNISTLWPASQEASSDREAILKNWFIDLNQDGISVIVLTHAGKSGDFLGDSSQIHILDSVLKLRWPAGYRRSDQLRAHVELQKVRHECRDSRLLQEFEVHLEMDQVEGATWTMRKVTVAQMQEVFSNFRDGMKPGEIDYQRVGVSRATIFRWKRKYEENSDPSHWSERES